MKRSDTLRLLARHLTTEAVIVAVGGLIDEWASIAPRALNYYSGGMGLAGSLGLGLALACPERKVIVLDGDGAVLMNLGSLVTAAEQAPPNLLHLVFDNGVYASSGGAPLPGSGGLRIERMAQAAGIGQVRRVSEIGAWESLVPALLVGRGHGLVVLTVSEGDAMPRYVGDKVHQRGMFEQALRGGGC